MKTFKFIFCIVIIFFIRSRDGKATTYNLISGGSVGNLTDWGTNTDGTGTHPGSFGGADVWNIVNNSFVSLNFTWGIASNSTVNVGDGSSNTTFYLFGSAGIGSGTQPIVNILNNGTLRLDCNFNLHLANTIPLAGSTVYYGNNSPNVIALNVNFAKLKIGVDVGISSAIINVDENLDIDLGADLALNGNTLVIGGTISGLGQIDGGVSGPSAVNFTGTGGTINFNTGGRISSFTLNLVNSSDVLSLGTDLTVDLNSPDLHMTKGILDLAGKKLTCNGAITFNSNASLRGSTSSSLVIGGSGSITNNLLMDNSSSATRAIGDLLLDRSGATLTLGNALDVYGSITPSVGTLATGGNLTLKSNATNKGRIGIMTASGNLSGSTTVEIFKPAGLTEWVNLCSGGVTGKNFSDWNASFAITCPIGCPDGSLVAGQPFTSVYSYNEALGSGTANASAHYVDLPGTSTVIDSKSGYWVYLGNNYPNTSDMVLTLSGTVNTNTSSGAINITVTGGAGAENGWNLIANPFPSPIQVSEVITAFGANIDPLSLFAYDPDSPGMVLYTSGDVIPIGQSFYVRALNNAGVIPNESWKTTSADNSSIFKAINGVNQPVGSGGRPYYFDDFLIELQCSNPPTPFFSQAYFAFEPNATTGYDIGKDAYYLENLINPNVPSIYSVSNNNKLLRQALASLSGSITIPIQVNTSYAGQYKLNPVNIAKLPSGACIILHDLVNNLYHDLRTGAYTTTIAAGQNLPQFELQITLNNVGSVTYQTSDPLCTNTPSGIISAKCSGTGPWNYTWKDHNNHIIKQTYSAYTADTLKGQFPGNYLIEINNTGTCDQASAQINLQASTPIPVSQFILSQSSAGIYTMEYLEFTNYSQNASNYEWDFGNGAAAGTINGVQVYELPGSYTVKLNAYNICGEESTSQMEIQVAENPVRIGEQLHPDPALLSVVQEGEELWVLNHNLIKGYKIEVYNGLGQNFTYDFRISGEIEKEKLNLVPTGNLILLRFSNGEHSYSQKLIY